MTPDDIVRIAAEEAGLLAGAGFDGLIIENMHDAPYVHGSALGPETVALMTRVALAVRAAAGEIPIGIQILSGGNEQALGVAHAAGLAFIRCENFVFAHVADEGLLPEAEAGGLLRYRRMIGAEGVRVFADIKKKHASHAITADVSLSEAARAAAFFGADGLIVTGTHTGVATTSSDIAEACAASELPVLAGSGVTPEGLGGAFEHADALIVGSALKRGGVWSEPIDPARVAALVGARDSLVRG